MSTQVPQKSIDLVFTKHKNQLQKLLRWERFKQDETAEEWLNILGPDVVSLTHPEVTVSLAQKLIDFYNQHGQALAEDEQVLLLTAAWVHDWGELEIDGHGVGDISFDQKNDGHEQTELEVFERVIKDIDSEDDRQLIKKAYTEVVIDRKSKLAEIFNVIERLGYLQTAIRAYQGQADRRIDNWLGLVGNALSNQIEPLLKLAESSIYAMHKLIESKSIINQMLADVLAEPVPADTTGADSYDLARLRSAQDSWINSSFNK